MLFRRLWCSIALMFALAAAALGQPAATGDVTLRVAVFEVGEIRTRELLTADSPRLKQLAEVIQRLRPNILLLSGIAYDGADAPDVKPGAEPGQNGQRFTDLYLAKPQAEDLLPIRLKAFMAPVNSGVASGMDLDHNGRIVTTYPLPGAPAAGTDAAAYSGDCWGPGAYPGQHGMALLVDERLTILADRVRTFRRFPWDYMPGAKQPRNSDGKPWHTEQERALVRLSSVAHWDIPVRLANGEVLHILCSRPIAPTGDDPPHFARSRHHDELRFWADYVEEGGYIVDDRNAPGPLDPASPFVILGCFRAAPAPEPAAGDPIGTVLFAARRLNPLIVPQADLSVAGLDPAATCFDNLRADYVLPSRDLGIAATGIWRHPPAGRSTFPSRHFPVWMDVVVPAPPHPSSPEGRSPARNRQ